MNYIFYLTVFILGLCFGSFINALIYRLRSKKSLWLRSECPQCQKEIKWYDNVPILSFFILKAKCRNCQQKISWQYPLVELIVGLLFLFVGLEHQWQISVELFRDFVIVLLLVVIFIYDYKHGEILDSTTLIPAGILFIFSLLFNWLSWDKMLLGLAVGAGFFLIQYLISRGRWIGGGDIRLGLFMGVILGWPNILLALFIAYIFGAVLGIILLLFKKKKLQSEIPFGTFLAMGTLVAMFWGNHIVNWYLSLLS